MKITALLFILLIHSAHAQKNATTGNVISADAFNSSTLSVGTVQQSILSVVKFQELNGDCWRLMDGSSIVGTDLAILIVQSNLPDMTTDGMFLRQAKSGRALGSSELDDFKSHTHIQNAHNHAVTLGGDGASAGATAAQRTVNNFAQLGTSSATATNQNTGGLETRPKNIALNFLIKVNKVCNFTNN